MTGITEQLAPQLANLQTELSRAIAAGDGAKQGQIIRQMTSLLVQTGLAGHLGDAQKEFMKLPADIQAQVAKNLVANEQDAIAKKLALTYEAHQKRQALLEKESKDKFAANLDYAVSTTSLLGKARSWAVVLKGILAVNDITIEGVDNFIAFCDDSAKKAVEGIPAIDAQKILDQHYNVSAAPFAAGLLGAGELAGGVAGGASRVMAGSARTTLKETGGVLGGGDGGSSPTPAPAAGQPAQPAQQGAAVRQLEQPIAADALKGALTSMAASDPKWVKMKGQEDAVVKRSTGGDGRLDSGDLELFKSNLIRILGLPDDKAAETMAIDVIQRAKMSSLKEAQGAVAPKREPQPA